MEDARESTPSKPNRQGYRWLGAGLLVGGGLAVLFLGVDSAPGPTTSTVAASDTHVVTISGIGEEIPSFPDGLMAVKRSDGQSLQLVIWPESGDPSIMSVPVGTSSPPDPVAFDVSGRLLATVLPVPGEVGGVLYAGVPDAARIVALDVNGYGWHDSTPEALAYTTLGDGETLLWVTRGNLGESEMVARAVGIEGGVVAWGDWGFAVQNGDSVALLTNSGGITEIGTGRILASHESGWVAVDDNGLRLLNVGGGGREIADVEFEDPILDAAFSPDGRLLGVLTVQGLRVIPVDTGPEVAVALERPGVAQAVWTSDSRYALFPGLRGVIVLDTSDGTVRELLPSDIFTGLGVFNFDEP